MIRKNQSRELFTRRLFIYLMNSIKSKFHALYTGYYKTRKYYDSPNIIPAVTNNLCCYIFSGKCGNDGFYYRDHASFVICSNGNAYEQPCAPGSRNSAFDHYSHGTHYYYRDFCDVNLVDYGAGIPYGYGHHGGNGYGFDGHHGGHGYGFDGHHGGY